jgi:urease accessory protein UreH
VTALVDCHGELPLLFQRPLRGPSGAAIMVMLTPAAALFDGDTINLAVECGPDTDVTLVTAGATRLNRCQRGGIRFSLEADVAATATFRHLPHELIPFRGAVYWQHVSVRLHHGATALLLDVVTPGRSDDPFSYSALTLETTVSLDGPPIAREHLVLTSAARPALADQTHTASLLAFGPSFDRASADCAHAQLTQAGLRASASTLPSYGIAVKALGTAAHSLRRALLCAVGVTPALTASLPP